MIYPKIRDGQFAVTVAYCLTGKILNVEGEMPKSVDEPIFHVFNSMIEVYSFIRRRILEDNTLEFSICDKNFDIVHYLKNKEARDMVSESD